jgi:hypothetical protein
VGGFPTYQEEHGMSRECRSKPAKRFEEKEDVKVGHKAGFSHHCKNINTGGI